MNSILEVCPNCNGRVQWRRVHYICERCSKDVFSCNECDWEETDPEILEADKEEYETI